MAYEKAQLKWLQKIQRTYQASINTSASNCLLKINWQSKGTAIPTESHFGDGFPLNKLEIAQTAYNPLDAMNDFTLTISSG